MTDQSQTRPLTTRELIAERLSPSPAVAAEPVALLQQPQYIIEGIILRRLHEKRIEGYTIETAKEIANAILAGPVQSAPNPPKQYRWRIKPGDEWTYGTIRPAYIEDCEAVPVQSGAGERDQELNLLRSQLANCHKEIFSLRDALLANSGGEKS